LLVPTDQENHMSAFKNFAAVTTLALVTANASAAGPGAAAQADEHTSHHPEGAPSAPAATMPAMQDRMKAMREMHDKMMNAKTPAERQALMADHMKAMQDGMETMKGMGGTGGMGGMGMAGGMGSGKAMPADMANRQQMMEGRMDMMQMMMEMMMQRLPGPPPAK
jgi:hypothetical protein